MNPDNSNEFQIRARADFSRARFKSFLNDIFSLFARRPNQLLSYDEVKEKLRIGGPIYRGIRVVRIDQIVGSLNRYHQFDRAFLPKQAEIAERWQRVNLAFYQDISLPPVLLYQVGEVYFVVDGHHRVSVAREQGQEFIEAEVRECSSKIKITPDLLPEELEILSEKVEFLERTRIDQLRPNANIKLTVLGGFSRILEHVAVHRYFMGLDEKRDIGDDEAVAHWYDTVYAPIIAVIQQSGILQDFPNKTAGDVYLWVLDHQHELNTQIGLDLLPPEDAARDFIKSQNNLNEESE